MKKLLTLTFCSCFFLQLLIAQNCETGRYRSSIFSETTVTYDIVYGQADPYDIFNLSNEEDLELDFYEPSGDTLSQRPLVLMFFGGGFLTGDKNFVDMVAWGDSLARQGYVVAAVNYRLGFNVLIGESAERAVYRSIQDARAAIRFFKEYHAAYRIDTTNIFLGGNSAGSFTSLHTAFVTEESERPPATFGINNPLSNEDNDLGCLDCSGNDFNHTVEVAGVINLWGAIYDTLFIDADEQIPVLHIHGTEDGTVPFESGSPFGGVLPLPTVYGSKIIHERMVNLGIYDEYFPYAGFDHSFYLSGLMMNEYWPPVFNQGRNFLWNIQVFQTPAVEGDPLLCVGTTVTYEIPFTEGSKYCWDIENGTIVSENNNQITITWDVPNVIGKISVVETNYYDLSGESSYFEVEIADYPTAIFSFDINDQEVIFTNMSTGATSWYWEFGNNMTSDEEHPVQVFDPGTYEVTLTTTNAAGCENSYSVTFTIEPNSINESSDPKQVLLISPNPVSEFLQLSFQSDKNTPVDIDIISIDGKNIQHFKRSSQIGENNFYFEVNKLIPGVYFVILNSGGQHQMGRFIKT